MDFCRGLALAAVFVTAACGERSETAVELELAYPDGWGLTELAVTAADKGGSVEPTHDLVVLIPDEWSDAPLTIEVRGLRGGEPWARGAVTVTPTRDRVVNAAVTLSRLPCGAWCAEGATMCQGDGVSICEQRDDDDTCFEWSDPVACDGETPFCSLGQCGAECIEECVEGETRCAGPAGTQACGENDGDDCHDWRAIEACPPGETCSNGACGAACADECVAGRTRCAGGGVETCGDLDANDCTEWSPPIACPSGSCTDGACDAACTDECSAPTCTGLTHHACGQFDPDPCDDLSPGTSCVPTVDCREGACSPTAGCTSTPTICDQPPDPICVDATTLRTFAAAGTCNADLCDYPPTDVTCSGGCSGGACTCGTTSCVEVFAANQDGARAIALDSWGVYWTNEDSGEVQRRSHAGGAIETIATSQGAVDGIAVDATTIYWSSWTDSEIRRRAKSGGAVSVFAADPDAMLGPQQIVTDATDVYFAETHGFRVLRKGKSGGALEPLADGGFSGDLAQDSQAVYYTAFDPINEVWRIAKSSGAETLVASAQGGARGIAVDATHVYWTNEDEDQVARRAKTGGPVEIFAQNQDGARGLALDATYVYWTDRDSDRVMRRAKAGGPVQTLATGQDGAYLIAVDDSYLYWTNIVDDQVMRIPLSCLCAP